jgi:histidine ammonia-lyase
MASSVIVDGASLSIDNIVAVAKNLSRVAIPYEALEHLAQTRKSIERILSSGRTVYGVNTGFGKLADKKVSREKLDSLQMNLIRSHSFGTGAPLHIDEVRAIMLVRLNTLLRGNSGVRTEVATKLAEFLNNRIHPMIPRFGSLGASGDLAPSAHLALSLVGEGYVIDEKGTPVRSEIALRRAKITPLRLRAKEGLAIINGTQVMAALGCLLIHDASSLLENLDIASAMTVEALGCSLSAFDSRVHGLRPLHGQSHVASRILKLVRDSNLVGKAGRVQDAYSLRCIPQVHGAFYDSIQYAKSILEVEINSVTDNPILFPETDELVNAGNFHGQPLSLALDLICLALAEASVISERRIDKLLSGYNKKLPLFLARETGFNSGFMVAQYTAASLVAENRVLAHPASLDSANVSAGQEDHSSMGVTAALKAKQVLDHTTKVISLEMMCAAQALDFLMPGKMGQGTAIAHAELRRLSNRLAEDRPLFEDLERISDALQKERISKAIERTVQL